MTIYRSTSAPARSPRGFFLGLFMALVQAVKNDLRIVTAKERERAMEKQAIETLRRYSEGESTVTVLWLVTQFLKLRVWSDREIEVATSLYTEAGLQEFKVVWRDGTIDRFVARVDHDGLVVDMVMPC